MNDADADGSCAHADNCPTVYSPDLADSDGNGIGDACDGPQDSDGDGIPDDTDQCPDSILDPTVVIPPTTGGPVPPGTVLPCDSGVPNYVLANGCTISDLVAACDASTTKKDRFVKCVKRFLKDLKKQGIITGKERKAVEKCAKRYKKARAHSAPAPSVGGAGDI